MYEMLFCEDECIMTTLGQMLVCHRPRKSCFPLCFFVVIFCMASSVKCLTVKTFCLLNRFNLLLSPVSFLHGKGSSLISKQTLHQPFYSQKKSIGIAFKVRVSRYNSVQISAVEIEGSFPSEQQLFYYSWLYAGPFQGDPVPGCQVPGYDVKFYLYVKPQWSNVFFPPTSYTQKNVSMGFEMCQLNLSNQCPKEEHP